ncbi:serine/threonine-protein phosphatase 6 regulatory ankyrin repeat subunit B-like [Haliotis asinina]|uniref:serine/threonine-protein phosphatase 6 regulatory ankyrin repeat subunit B-like n=1 Tax=Haliotis asinina TaxID=109174 RepID=UPI00353181AC
MVEDTMNKGLQYPALIDFGAVGDTNENRIPSSADTGPQPTANGLVDQISPRVHYGGDGELLALPSTHHEVVTRFPVVNGVDGAPLKIKPFVVSKADEGVRGDVKNVTRLRDGSLLVEYEHHQTHNRAFVNTTLIDACRIGDLHQVKYLLSHDPANVNSRGQAGRTPAMIAAVAGHRALLELLVEKGANLTLLDDEDNNILHVACMEGNLGIVKYIHSQKIIDIESRGRTGTTPLMSAAMFGKKDVFSFLMKIGADISKEDDDGENILHVSCQGGNVDIVKYVLKHNVLYINSTDDKGIAPLLLAAGYGNKLVFHFLIERGADTFTKDSTNRNVLHWACRGGSVKIVNYIITQNIVDINGSDDNNMTALLLAAYHGKIDVFRLLIEKGANTLAVNQKSRNSLHLSCIGGHVDTVKYVLNQTSVDINSKDCEKMTPVLLAAYHGKRELFDVLVKNGADLSVIDEDGDNILHWACRGGNVKIVTYILMQNIVDINCKGDEEMTPVLIAADHGKKDAFDILVKRGGDLSVIDEDRDNILHLACRGGHVKIVNYILMQNIVDINAKNTGGETPVMLAANSGEREVFDILVRKGADLSVIDNNDDNILHSACGGGNPKIVTYILMQNIVDINCKGDEEMTPVLIAAYYAKHEAFDILVKKEADLSVTDGDGDNILHLACRGGHVKIVNYILMQNIVDINAKNSGGETPVMLAAWCAKGEVFDGLVRKGADLSVIDEDGDNILHWACRGGNVKIVNYILMRNSVNINRKGRGGLTPVMLAAWRAKRKVFDSLVKKSADLSGFENYGKNILHLACEGTNVEIVKRILRLHIVDINCRFNEMTPLLLAVKYQPRNVFQLLLESGADPSLVNRDGDNALHLACMRGDEEIVKQVLKLHSLNINCRGSKGRTPLLLAAEYDSYNVFELLLESGADPSAVNRNGDNILHVACKLDREEIVKHVLKLHTLDINCRGDKGKTPLLVSAEYSTYGVFKLLLKGGANLSAVDNDGNSILHFASMGENEEIVKHILKLHVVDINCRGSKGMTPLLLAARQSTFGVFELLLDSGADPSVVNSDGDNVLHLACVQGDEDIVKYADGKWTET